MGLYRDKSPLTDFCDVSSISIQQHIACPEPWGTCQVLGRPPEDPEFTGAKHKACNHF